MYRCIALENAPDVSLYSIEQFSVGLTGRDSLAIVTASLVCTNGFRKDLSMFLPEHHFDKAALAELFDGHLDILQHLVSCDDGVYRSVMSQARFIGGSNAGRTSQRGYYNRKPSQPAALLINGLLTSMDIRDQTRLRNTLSYLRSERKRSERGGESVDDRRRRYQREYYAKRKRQRVMEVVRLAVPGALYKELVGFLDEAHRPDLTEKLMSCKR